MGVGKRVDQVDLVDKVKQVDRCAGREVSTFTMSTSLPQHLDSEMKKWVST